MNLILFEELVKSSIRLTLPNCSSTLKNKLNGILLYFLSDSFAEKLLCLITFNLCKILQIKLLGGDVHRYSLSIWTEPLISGFLMQ
jgi:hypothetical protein